MRADSRRIASLAFLLMLALASTGCAPRVPGVALVVGNARYAYATPLANPENDARAISEQLSDLGWQVLLKIDPSRNELEAAMKSLDAKLRTSDKSLFFYAGHGLQINGKNYLLPVDFNPARPVDLERDMIGIEQALTSLKKPNNQLAVFLDACRDNPFEGKIRSSGGTGRGVGVVMKSTSARSSSERSRSQGIQIGRGLAEVAASAGTFIAYATQPGAVAQDGTGRHSPFTGALLDYLTENNKDVGWVLQRVRNDVIEETRGKQVPWDHSSLTKRFRINQRQQRSPPP